MVLHKPEYAPPPPSGLKRMVRLEYIPLVNYKNKDDQHKGVVFLISLTNTQCRRINKNGPKMERRADNINCIGNNMKNSLEGLHIPKQFLVKLFVCRLLEISMLKYCNFPNSVSTEIYRIQLDNQMHYTVEFNICCNISLIRSFFSTPEGLSTFYGEQTKRPFPSKKK